MPNASPNGVLRAPIIPLGSRHLKQANYFLIMAANHVASKKNKGFGINLLRVL